MPVQLIRKVRDRQPQGLFVVKPEFRKNLDFLWVPGLPELTTMQPANLSGSGKLTSGRTGRVVKGAIVSYTGQGAYFLNQKATTANVTMIATIDKFGGVDNGGSVALLGNAASRGIQIDYNGQVRFVSSVFHNSGVNIDASPHVVGAVFGESYGSELFLDGKSLGYQSGSGLYAWSLDNYRLVLGGDSGNSLAGECALAVAWNVRFPAALASSLAINPWQIFEPETIPLFWPIATAKSAAASVSAAIRSGATASASLNAAIQSAATASATLSGAIQTAQSATSGLAAYIVASSARSESAVLSAAISDARTATSSLSAAVAAARTATATLDSAVQIEVTASTGVSAAIREAFSISANLSGAVQASATASASLAAVVAKTNAISSDLSAAVRAEQTAFAALSAYIAAGVVLTQSEVDMLTDIWQRFGLDPLAPLTETEAAASFGGIVLSKSGTNTITSTRSGNSAAGVASSMILDVWQRLGLDPDNPMTASETQISAGTLSQDRAVSGATVTVTRTP